MHRPTPDLTGVGRGDPVKSGVWPQVDIGREPAAGLTRYPGHFRKFAKTPVSWGQQRRHFVRNPRRLSSGAEGTWQILMSTKSLEPA